MAENTAMGDAPQLSRLGDGMSGVQRIDAPPLGSEVTVPVEPGQLLMIDGFAPDQATFVQDGADVIVAMDGHGTVVLSGFAEVAESDLPPALALADGTVLPAEEILAGVDGLDLARVEPAAGGTVGNGSGGGAGFEGFDVGDIGDGLAVQALLDETALEFGQIGQEPEPLLALTDEATQQELFPPVVEVTDGYLGITVAHGCGENDPQSDSLWIGDQLRGNEYHRLDPSAVNGVVEGSLPITGAASVTVDFQSEGAGYHNLVGWYKVVDGEVVDPQIIWLDSTAAKNNVLDSPLINDQPMSVVLNGGDPIEAGTEIGFFIVANALSNGTNKALVNGYDWDVDGINDALSLVDGKLYVGDQEVKGRIYYSHDAAANPDGIEHTVSGVTEDHDGWLYIGFEDLYNGGDKDYNDLIFRVDVGDFNYTNITSQVLDPTVSIDDIDSDLLSSAYVHADQLQAGDSLVFDESLLGDIIYNAVMDGGNVVGFEFEGLATIEAYEELLDSIRIAVGDDPVEGTREITFQVTDATNLNSNVAVANFDVSITDEFNCPDPNVGFG